MDFLSLVLLILLYSTLTCAGNKSQIITNPPYIVYIWRKSFLVSPNYVNNFCTGVMVRPDLLITNRDCINKYSRQLNPDDFIITAGPEIHRAFFNGAGINYCKEIFLGESPPGKYDRINSAAFMVTTSPFSTSSRVRDIQLAEKIFPVGTHCLVHKVINQTEGIKAMTLSTYIGKIIDASYCPRINTAYQYCIERSKTRKTAESPKGEKELDSYFICNGYFAGVFFGSQGYMKNDIMDRANIYESQYPLTNSDIELSPVVLIMLFLVNALLTILN